MAVTRPAELPNETAPAATDRIILDRVGAATRSTDLFTLLRAGPIASDVDPGLLDASDKSKLDGVEIGATANTKATSSQVEVLAGGGAADDVNFTSLASVSQLIDRAAKLRNGLFAPYVRKQLERNALGYFMIDNFLPGAQITNIRNGTSTYDATASLLGAINSGEHIDLGYGAFKATDRLSINPGQAFVGRGWGDTVIKIDQDCNLSAGAMLRGNDVGRIEDLRMDFYQPSTNNRANLIQYPWAIDTPTTCTHFTIKNVWIRQHINGIKLAGNSYGMIDVLMSGFGVDVDIDGALEFNKVDSVHVASIIAADPNLYAIYLDGQGKAADIGRADGLRYKGDSFCKPFICRDRGSGGPNVRFETVALDNNNAILDASAGLIAVGPGYGSQLGGDKPYPSGPAWDAASQLKIRISGTAEVTVAAGMNLQGNSVPGAPMVKVEGGSFIYTVGTIRQHGKDAPAIDVTGGKVVLGAGVIVAASNIDLGQARTVPLVRQSGTGSLDYEARHDLHGGTGTIVSFATDVAGNYLDCGRLRKGYVLPSSRTNGIYRSWTQGGRIEMTASDHAVTFPLPYLHTVKSIAIQVEGNFALGIADVQYDQLGLTGFVSHTRQDAGGSAGLTATPLAFRYTVEGD